MTDCTILALVSRKGDVGDIEGEKSGKDKVLTIPASTSPPIDGIFILFQRLPGKSRVIFICIQNQEPPLNTLVSE